MHEMVHSFSISAGQASAKETRAGETAAASVEGKHCCLVRWSFLARVASIGCRRTKLPNDDNVITRF